MRQREVGADVGEQEALAERYAGKTDPGRLAHPAVRPIATDYPVPPHRVAVSQVCGHAVFVLVGAHQLGSPFDPAAEVGEATAQLGLDLSLGDQESRPGDQLRALTHPQARHPSSIDVHHHPRDADRAPGQLAERTCPVEHFGSAGLQPEGTGSPGRPGGLIHYAHRHPVGQQAAGEGQAGRTRACHHYVHPGHT